jgi:penicillin-binding protein 2
MFLNKRYNVYALFLVGLFIYIISFLFDLQVLSRETALSDIDNQTLDTFYITPPRGDILDINSERLATSTMEPHLFLNLRKINDENLEFYEQFIKYNFPELDEDDLVNLFLDRRKIQIIENISDFSATERQKLLELDAFEIFDFPIRIYNYDNLTSHVIGYVGRPTSDDFQEFPHTKQTLQVGKNGLEKYYEDTLTGTPGEITFRGSDIVEYIPPIKGQNINISLNIDTQRVVKESLLQGIELANENEDTLDEVIRSASIVLDVNTGEIVSMVSIPDFNPNQFIDGISNQEYEKLNRIQAFNNFAIQGLYPPGSVFKVVSYWLAENEGLFPEGLNSRRGRIDCEGSLSFGFDDGSQQVYQDWKEDGHGRVNLSSAMQQSCNVYFWDIALKIWRTYEGSESESILQDYARNLGFGELTNIDLPFERNGIIPDREVFEEWTITRPDLVRPEGWLGGDLMNLIIGQGAITVTPIQVANAYKTLLTSTSSSPYLNIAVSDNLKLKKYNISNELVTFLKDDLNLVTNKNGTAYAAFEVMGRKANDIGGKTGTAQNPGEKNNTSWFVGIDSVKNPNHVVPSQHLLVGELFNI